MNRQEYDHLRADVLADSWRARGARSSSCEEALRKIADRFERWDADREPSVRKDVETLYAIGMIASEYLNG